MCLTPGRAGRRAGRGVRTRSIIGRVPRATQTTGKATPEPRAAARAAQVALWAIFGLNGAIVGTWAARVPAVKASAGLDDLWLGIALLGPALGALLAFEMTGRIIERAGSAVVTRVAAVATALTPIAIVAGDGGLLTLAAGLVVFGFAGGALDVAMNAHGVAVERQIGRPVLSGMHAAFSGGALAGTLAGALAIRAGAGVWPHFVVAAALAAAVALWAGASIRPLRVPVEPVDVAAPRRRGMRAALPTPVLVLGAIGFACMLGEGAALDWSATYLRDTVGASGAVAALGYAGFSAAMLAGRLLGDRMRAALAPATLLAISAGVAGVSLATGLVAGGTAAGIIGLTLFGAGLAVIVPVVFAGAASLQQHRTGMPRSMALARTTSLAYLGFLAGPALVGLLAGAVGLRVALLCPAVLVASVALVAWVGRNALAGREAVAPTTPPLPADPAARAASPAGRMGVP